MNAHVHDSKTALIVVDVQNDFLPPGGPLAVPRAREILTGVQNSIGEYHTVVVTLDYHPAGHKSFASAHSAEIGSAITLNGTPQVLWPDHCVQNTPGVQLEQSIAHAAKNHSNTITVHKGTNIECDSYSAFFDNDGMNKTTLDETLRERGIDTLHVCGLATDFCVKFTVLDACKLGYNTTVLRSLCRAVNLQPGDEQHAIDKMQKAGARIAG